MTELSKDEKKQLEKKYIRSFQVLKFIGKFDLK